MMRVVLALYATTVFLSAFLLFLVQPLFTKMALPLLGSSPSVWNTAVVFFQATVLAGYLYAHATTVWVQVRTQIMLHFALVLLALVLLPIGIPDDWRPPAAGNPIPWLLGLLLIAIGLPFFVLSTTSPLLQAWFARTGHPAAGDPYFLYAAGNAGSMLALLTYPVLVEPHLRLQEQNRLWAAAYAALALLLAACAASVWSRFGVSRAVHPPAVETRGAQRPVAIRRRARWVLLAGIPSSLMLSVTTYLSTDIPPLPLLWVIPLSIYLLTFILAFAAWSRRLIQLTAVALAPALLAVGSTMVADATRPMLLVVALHLVTLFLAALLCHGALAADRPAARQLTEYYVWLSAGGVLGGVFTAVLAPLLFTAVLEYPFMLALLALLGPTLIARPDRVLRTWQSVASPVAGGLLSAVVVIEVRSSGGGIDPALLLLAGCLLLVGAAVFGRRPAPASLGLVAMVGTLLFVGGMAEPVLHAERSFFGVGRVLLDGEAGSHRFMHGSTLHGIQSLDPARRREPLTYYTRSGPIGQLFTALGEAGRVQRVGVVGLGTGSLACYHQPGQEWTFYEIDPAVERIARDARYFTLLEECAPGAEVVLGDGRLSLAQADGARYDLLVLDAYSSDAIPVHLITREALALYRERLTDTGVVAFHISNRYLDLAPVLSVLAEDAGLVGLVQADPAVDEDDWAQGKLASEWVVLARTAHDLALLLDDRRWQPLRAEPGSRVWTDDFSSVLSVLRWR